MTHKILSFFCLACCLNLGYAQNVWSDASNWGGNNIPNANTKITLDSETWIVPAGFQAECKDLKLNGAGFLEDDTEVIIYGTLTVFNKLKMESDILSGIFLKPASITIAAGGKLIVHNVFDIKGDYSSVGDKQIIVDGEFEVYKPLDLNNKDTKKTGLEIIVGSSGIISLHDNNKENESLITVGSGAISFDANSQINLTSSTGVQYINSEVILPNIAVVGGHLVTLPMSLDATHFSGNIIVENGELDLGDFNLSGNGTNKIIVANNGTLTIGGNNTFPISSGDINAFIAPDLQKGSTVKYNGESDQDVAGQSYWNLTLSDKDGGANAVKYTKDRPSIQGILDINDDVILNTTTSKFTLISSGELIDETAMIGPVTGDIVGDSVVVQRYIDLTDEPNNRYGWNDWCSPIIENTLKSWSNCCVRTTGFPGSTQPSSSFNSVLYYDAEKISTSKNQGWTGATNITNEIGLGNAVRFYDGNFQNVLSDLGSVHVGDFTVNLKYKDIGIPDEEGYNLLGNPYACALDWTKLYNEGTVGNVYNAFWLYSNATGYYTYNGLTGIGTGLYAVQEEILSSGLIASHKGFWVKANAVGASMTFKETFKNTGGVTFLKSGKPNYESLRVQIESDMNGYKNAAVLVLVDQSSLSVDPYDAEFLAHPLAAAPGIGFTETSGVNLSINAIPKTPSFKEIPLFIKIGKNGTYRLRFYDLEKMNTQHCIALIDTETGATYNIRETPVISVNLTTTTNSNRFKLMFGSPLQGKKLKDITCAGYNDGQVLVSWSANPSSYFDVYKNDEIIYSNFQQTLFFKDVEPGVFKIIPNDPAGYCEGAFYEVNVLEPKVVIAQIAAPDEIDQDNAFETLVTFYNVSAGAFDFQWNFGDGQVSYDATPHHVYAEAGVYQVSLIANNQNSACGDTAYHELTIKAGSFVGIEEDMAVNTNPYNIARSDDFYTITWKSTSIHPVLVDVYNINGQLVTQNQLNGNKGSELTIKTDSWSHGIYVLKMKHDNQYYHEKLMK